MNNWTTGFFQDDLNVFYEEYFYVKKEHSKDIVWPYKTLKNLYVLFYVINGECELKYDDFKGTIKKNSLVLVRPQQLFQYTFKKDKQFEYLIIDIQPTVLKKQVGDLSREHKRRECELQGVRMCDDKEVVEAYLAYQDNFIEDGARHFNRMGWHVDLDFNHHDDRIETYVDKNNNGHDDRIEE